MPLDTKQEVTALLQKWSDGDTVALEELTPVIYEELHRIARRYMSRERDGHTLQTTALVNEAYLRLIDWKHEPVLEDVPVPTPGPRDVVIKVGGAGACHSDLHLMHEFEPGILPWSPPFTMRMRPLSWGSSSLLRTRANLNRPLVKSRGGGRKP